MVPCEVEAKLTVTRAADARSIATLRTLGGYHLRVLPTQRLRTLYLDTPTFSLARNGVALRVRRDGTVWEATAKWAGHVDGALHRRPELTVPLATPPRFPFVLPAGPLAVQLTALVADRPLHPILVTEILRQRRAVVAEIEGGAARPLAELDIDCVTLRQPRMRNTQPPFWEVEIELGHGAQRDVLRLAQLLRRQYRAQPSVASKFMRGMRIFHPSVSAVSGPRPIAAADSVATAVRTIIGRHLTRMQRHDPATRTGEQPEAVHDMRVATRRLRAAIRALKPGIPIPLRQHLNRELGWLGQVLGDVRDIDVQLAHLAKHGGTGAAAELEPLRRHLLAQRQRRRAPLKAALNAPRYTQLIAALDAFAIEQSGAQAAQTAAHPPAAQRGRRALRKRLRRLLEDGRRALAKPTAERLHTLRISAKRARYVLEFLQDLTGKPGQRLTKTLVELQDTLGMQHDAVVAMTTTREVLRRLGPSASRSVTIALRGFAAAQQRDATTHQRAAQTLWKRFTQPRLAKDVRATLDRLERVADHESS